MMISLPMAMPGEPILRVAGGMGTPRDDEPGMGRLLNAWRLVCEAQAPTFKVKKALHKQQIKAANLLEAVPEAVRGYEAGDG